MIMSMLMAGALAMDAQPSQTVIAPAPRQETEGPDRADGTVTLINRAASLVRANRIDEARMIYVQLERAPAETTLETTDGRWLYPAEIARRSLERLDRQGRSTRLATRN